MDAENQIICTDSKKLTKTKMHYLVDQSISWLKFRNIDFTCNVWSTFVSTVAIISSSFSNSKYTCFHHNWYHSSKYQPPWAKYHFDTSFWKVYQYNMEARYWLKSLIYCPISRYPIRKPFIQYGLDIQYLEIWLNKEECILIRFL